MDLRLLSADARPARHASGVTWLVPLLLGLGLTPCASHADVSSGDTLAAAPCPAALDLQLAGRDGFPLHLTHYRPAGGASLGVVLIHDWGSSGAPCWGDVPRALCQAGLEVLVPDLRGHGASVMPEMLRPLSPVPSRGELALLATDASLWCPAFSDSVRRVVAIGLGWGGAAATRLDSPGRELVGIAWLGPLGDAAAFPWQPRDRARRSLLLVASLEDAVSSRVAEALFSRFNDVAELRLFDRGAGGCALLSGPGVGDGLRDWVAGFAPPTGTAR